MNMFQNVVWSTENQQWNGMAKPFGDNTSRSQLISIACIVLMNILISNSEIIKKMLNSIVLNPVVEVKALKSVYIMNFEEIKRFKKRACMF